MRVLLDNCLPVGLRHLRGWGDKGNGQLVAAAIESGFDILLSIDQGPMFEVAVRGRPISAVLFPGSQGSRLDDLRPLIPDALIAIANAKPGTITRIGT